MDLAEFLELTEKEIAGLTKRDVIPAVGKGQYNLFESIKAYIRHLRENAANSENRIDRLVLRPDFFDENRIDKLVLPPDFFETPREKNAATRQTEKTGKSGKR